MLTLPELAEMLGEKQAKIRALCKAGMPHEKQGRSYAFDEQEVYGWLTETGRAKPRGKGQQVVRTQLELAKALNSDVRTVQYWCKEPGFPGKTGDPRAGKPSGRYDVEEVRRWLLKAHPTHRSAAHVIEGEPESIKLQRARRKRAEFEYEKERGNFLHVDEVRRFCMRTVTYVVQVVDQMPDRLAAELPDDIDGELAHQIVAVAKSVSRQARIGIRELITGDRDEAEHAVDWDSESAG